MRVLVDTSVWSLALRRKRTEESRETNALSDLIQDGRASLIGAVRQEILSGVRDTKQFDRLKAALDAFPDHPVTSRHYVVAAQICNTCIASGTIAGNTDCLIAAVAIEENMEILTTDKDFQHMAKVLPLRLH